MILNFCTKSRKCKYSMLDHKPRLNHVKCIYQYANYLVICVKIDCTHSRSWVPYFTGCGSTRPDGGRHCRLGGDGWLAQGCVWVALSIWTCKIIIFFVKTIIIITMICNSPLSKHWLVCWKLSPALSTLWAILSPALCTLWTQHCSGGRRKQPYTVCHSSRISYTHISQRDP